MAQSHPGASDQPRTHHILVVDDEDGRRAFLLTEVAYTLGRDPTCSIVLHSPAVSRQHALLVRLPSPSSPSGYGYKIQDGNVSGQESRNGLLIQGVRHKSRNLEDGDQVQFSRKVSAGYYIRTMTDAELERYTTSVPFRSIKAATIDPTSTTIDLRSFS